MTPAEQKVTLGAVPYLYPVPIVLVGAQVDGRANFETLGDCALAGIRPALVMISSGADHHTNQGILANGTFSVNIPNTALLEKVDVCGMVSGRNVDKSALFDVFYGALETAPLIRECPVNLECRVLREFSIEHRQVFVGEVVETHIDAAFAEEVAPGKWRVADVTRLDPVLYALDNQYYGIGAPIGTGYEVGKPLKARLES